MKQGCRCNALGLRNLSIKPFWSILVYPHMSCLCPRSPYKIKTLSKGHSALQTHVTFPWKALKTLCWNMLFPSLSLIKFFLDKGQEPLKSLQQHQPILPYPSKKTFTNWTVQGRSLTHSTPVTTTMKTITKTYFETMKGWKASEAWKLH